MCNLHRLEVRVPSSVVCFVVVVITSKYAPLFVFGAYCENDNLLPYKYPCRSGIKSRQSGELLDFSRCYWQTRLTMSKFLNLQSVAMGNFLCFSFPLPFSKLEIHSIYKYCTYFYTPGVSRCSTSLAAT